VGLSIPNAKGTDFGRPQDGTAGAAILNYRLAGSRDLVSPFKRSMAKLRLVFYGVLGVCDIGIIFLLAVLVRPAGVDLDRPTLVAQLLCFVLVTTHTHCYGIDAIRYPREGAARAALSIAIASLACFALGALFHHRPYALNLVACQAAFTMLGLYAGRKVAVAAFRGQTGGQYVNQLVLVDGKPSRDYQGEVVIFASEAGLDPVVRSPDFLNRLGNLLKDCDRVVIDADAKRRQVWLEALRGTDVDVELAAPEFVLHQPLALRTMGGLNTVLMRQGALTTALRFQKRVMDIVVASVALVLAAPVMAVVAILVMIGSPGPVLFKQWRVGRGNRQFLVFKFRTMYHGSVDHLDRPLPADPADRVTQLGRFMRGTSLDELPQLINVLRGEMSIVGPRPHALASRAGEHLFWNVDDRYWDRHAIKPGMTGLAQVRGLRGPTPTRSDLSLRLISDIEYIANWSLLSDIFILLRTIRVVVHRNAK
jgi:lipopolysaccharide/colanic/teichoic acid biosynthesis glycosyltransferase